MGRNAEQFRASKAAPAKLERILFTHRKFRKGPRLAPRIPKVGIQGENYTLHIEYVLCNMQV
jgi:hypothetical protein